MGSRRGSATGRALVAVLLVVGGWGALAGATSAAPPRTPDLDGTYLPAHRPVGYRLPELSGTGTDGGGSRWREVTLEPVDLVSQPVVALCTTSAEHALCAAGDRRVVRRVGPLVVSVALTGGSSRSRRAAAAYWRRVRLVPADRLEWPAHG